MAVGRLRPSRVAAAQTEAERETGETWLPRGREFGQQGQTPRLPVAPCQRPPCLTVLSGVQHME